MADYEERYCAFVDILGFSQLVSRLDMEQIRRLLQIIHNPPTVGLVRNPELGDVRAQSISDAVCISAACHAYGLMHLFFVLEELAIELLGEGHFLRGAIVRGKLFHDENMVFGEALIDAYRLEQDIARYPRIMITSAVIRDIVTYREDEQFDAQFFDSVAQSSDGPRFLNVLDGLATDLSVGTDHPRHVRNCNKLADQIEIRLEESFDNPRYFEKVQWFVNYWNRTMMEYTGVRRITGPGVIEA